MVCRLACFAPDAGIGPTAQQRNNTRRSFPRLCRCVRGSDPHVLHCRLPCRGPGRSVQWAQDERWQGPRACRTQAIPLPSQGAPWHDERNIRHDRYCSTCPAEKPGDCGRGGCGKRTLAPRPDGS
jgi:hypothetical protein